MSDEPTTQKIDNRPFIERLGVSGVFFAFAGFFGLIVGFLPMSSGESMPKVGADLGGMFKELGMGGLDLGGGGMGTPPKKVIDDFKGLSCVTGYIMALFFAFRLYSRIKPIPQRITWLAFATGGGTLFCALWILISGPSTGGEYIGIGGGGGKLRIGAYLNILPAAAFAIGAFLKAQEEKLI